MRLKNNLTKDAKQKVSKSSREHLYHTMEPPHKKSLGRNCVSLENLGVFVTEDSCSNNFPPTVYQVPAYFYYHPYQQQPPPQHMMPVGYQNIYLANQSRAYHNNSSSLGNSKQSLDDFRKYRDVAL